MAPTFESTRDYIAPSHPHPHPNPKNLLDIPYKKPQTPTNSRNSNFLNNNSTTSNPSS